jgi:hypothetical protein
MQSFPAEFADLLTRKGRLILDGRAPEVAGALADPARFFVALDGAIDRGKAEGCRRLLDRHLWSMLTTLAAPIPPESITGQTRNHQERLRKTARVKTAYLERRSSGAWRAAERIGLVAMLGSATFRQFTEAIAGRALDPRLGRQVLCYRPGDYAGPHTDHHPEDARAAGGYIDVHLTFSSSAVAHHYLVYARGGHFSEMADVNTVGGITIYRLPFWHYTTPLVAKPGRAHDARRWVALGTFLYA